MFETKCSHRFCKGRKITNCLNQDSLNLVQKFNGNAMKIRQKQAYRLMPLLLVAKSSSSRNLVRQNWHNTVGMTKLPQTWRDKMSRCRKRSSEGTPGNVCRQSVGSLLKGSVAEKKHLRIRSTRRLKIQKNGKIQPSFLCGFHTRKRTVVVRCRNSSG